MRILTFDKGGVPTLGLRDGDTVIDLSVADPDGPRDLIGIMKQGQAGLDRAAAAAKTAPDSARIDHAGIQHHPLTRNAPKMLCLGLNYAAHAAEGGHEPPVFPTIFMRGGTSLVGHGQPLMRSPLSETLDYEAELVAFIGKTARKVSEADALDHVVGYSCFNDGSVREYQRMTPQWTVGKNFDETGPFGPEFVSADELPPGADGLKIQSRLNGKVMQDDNTSNMIFPVAKTIELLSACMTLEAGDVLVMGTPEGVGHARKPPAWMRDGDTIEIEIEGIGVLSNPIKDEA
ncbi:MAG: fumarylacetoacetate hydrolase family protein [Rhodospirillaceae bacterium]|nr:fumarylacetoacetate hydrolase family protein [Rhodospirillaceae bacterium]